MKINVPKHHSVLVALLAALLFGLNAPLSKLLLADISPMFMAAFLYLGAGLGMSLLRFWLDDDKAEAPLTRKEMPWTISMILLDVIAPFLLMLGLTKTTAANASLLFNFEMVATSMMALWFFHESIGKRMWLAIAVITVASILLCVDFNDVSIWKFSIGSLLVLAACCCWGLENNCTRNMSAKSPAQIVIVKGFGSGFTAMLAALIMGNEFPHRWGTVAVALALGFVAYGLSIFFYVYAQRTLGASRTSAYYAAAPFMGVLLSMLILGEFPGWSFYIALLFMFAGVWITIQENHVHRHRHEKNEHEHAHSHDDMHHDHTHESINIWHSHAHIHAESNHDHVHTPDIHHRHLHD